MKTLTAKFALLLTFFCVTPLCAATPSRDYDFHQERMVVDHGEIYRCAVKLGPSGPR